MCALVGSLKYNLVEIETPTVGSYIQLETFYKDKNFARVIHHILPDASKLQFKLGRGHDSDIKIADISVSRVHAQIKMTPGGFLLEDNASKFGTLLLLPAGPHEITAPNGLSVQINRTTISMSIQPRDLIPKENRSTAVLANGMEVKVVDLSESGKSP